MRRKTLARIGTLLVATVLALLVGELLVRGAGHQPARDRNAARDAPALHGPDPVLGWTNRPGVYVIPSYTPSGDAIQVTFEQDGRRRSSPEPPRPGNPDLVFLGGSFTQGWAIDDDETFAWKVQAARPGWNVRNHGVAGYGTYQSLLLLERLVAAIPKPRLVIYGFVDHHELRNIAPRGWLALLSSFPDRGQTALPFAELAPGGGLVRHPPIRHPRLPLRHVSALVTRLEWWIAHLRERPHPDQRRKITREILRTMARESHEHGAELHVVLLTATDVMRRRYADMMREDGIALVDCSRELTPRFRVVGEGHPNGRLHSLWAECMLAGIPALAPDSPATGS
jgi:hypothetical protein